MLQVYITDPWVSDWLLYRPATSTLEGVPSSRHKQLTHNVIVTLLRDDFIKLTIPCAVYVSDDVPSNDVKLHDNEFQRDEGVAGLRCAPNEPLVVLSATLNVTQSQLDATGRVELVIRSCDFLKQYVSCDGITLGTGSQGNVTSYVKVSWRVACGTESVGSTLLQFVGTAEKNGQLSSGLGFGIISWKIENKKQSSYLPHDKKINNRLKR